MHESGAGSLCCLSARMCEFITTPLHMCPSRESRLYVGTRNAGVPFLGGTPSLGMQRRGTKNFLKFWRFPFLDGRGLRGGWEKQIDFAADFCYLFLVLIRAASSAGRATDS